MNARRLISTALVSLCTVVGALALGGVSAQAAITHKYLSQITEVPAWGRLGNRACPGPVRRGGGSGGRFGRTVCRRSFQRLQAGPVQRVHGRLHRAVSAGPGAGLRSASGARGGAWHGETEVYVAGDQKEQRKENEGARGCVWREWHPCRTFGRGRIPRPGPSTALNAACSGRGRGRRIVGQLSQGDRCILGPGRRAGWPNRTWSMCSNRKPGAGRNISRS